MIRFVLGMGLVFGAIGGIEVGNLTALVGMPIAILGNIFCWWSVLDGSLHRLAGVKKEW